MKYSSTCEHCGKIKILKYKPKSKTKYCHSCVAKQHTHKSKNIINEIGEKKCTTCGLFLDKKEFQKVHGYNEINASCNRCYSLRKYKINRFDYEAMLIKQNHKCAICGGKEIAKRAKGINADKIRGLAVDHCHTTGKIRGLLCGNCNRGLGSFKDNENRLWQAIIYLKRNKS